MLSAEESPRSGTRAEGSVGEIPRANADDPNVSLQCAHYDVEQVAKISDLLQLSLATACVEKTAGDPFNQPQNVYGDVKKEMLDYLNVQSEAFANGKSTVVFQISGEIPSPVQAVQDIVSSFIMSKKSLFSRVSSKLLYSDKKDDKIEDFVQEMNLTGAWMVGRRETLARALLDRVDSSNIFHCQKKFEKFEELSEHKSNCTLRPVTCPNEGCNSVFSAFNMKKHDSTCKFKVQPCEQGCNTMVARGEMDMHCVTLCPMKVVNCPFAQVGCTHTIAQGVQDQHCEDYIGQHLLLLCQNLQRQGVSVANQGQRVALLEKAMQLSQRTEAVDIGTLLITVREQEIRLKTQEQELLKLRQELKSTEMAAEVLQLRRDMQNIQRSLQNGTSISPLK